MMNTKDSKTRIYRWSLLLQEYDFEVVHIKGIYNYTDYMSRGFRCNLAEEENKNIKIEIEDSVDQRRLIEHYHQMTGHVGKQTVIYLLKQKFKWKHLNKTCEEFIKGCEICERDSRIKGQSEIIACSIEKPNKRWEIDLIGPMPGTGYVMSVIDVFTRYASTRILKDKSSGRILKALIDITRSRTPPECILADNGREFTNSDISSWCKEMEIELKHGSPYTPTTTGAVERFNQSLMRKLRRITEFGRKNWKDCLAKATDAYNKSFNRATGCGAIEFINGEVRFKIDKEFGAIFQTEEKMIMERAEKLQRNIGQSMRKKNPRVIIG